MRRPVQPVWTCGEHYCSVKAPSSHRDPNTQAASFLTLLTELGNLCGCTTKMRGPGTHDLYLMYLWCR
jgi:hypothetical protein